MLVRPPNPPLVPTLRVSARSAAQRQRWAAENYVTEKGG